MKKFKLVTKDIYIDVEEIKKILDEWQSGEIYRFYYAQGGRGEQLYKSILAKIAHCIDGIADAIRESANLANDECLDWTAYPKSDKWSIIFAILNLLDDGEWRMPERLTTEDIPAILEFLDTPPGKELEAWDKWEKYWDNLDYPARRKRLLSGEAHGEEKE